MKKRNRSTARNAAVITALSAGVFAGSMGIASAATSGSTSTAPSATASHFHPDGQRGPGGPGGPGGHARFTVTSVGNGTFTVTDRMGKSVTVTTTSSTTYDKDGKATTASALAVGEHVDIRPVASSTAPTPGSPITAAEVDILSPRLDGTVVSVDASAGTIVVADDQGFYRTIAVTSATTYTKDGSSATSAAVAVGAHVEATGAIDANHTSLDATSVNVGKPAKPAGAPSLPNGAMPQMPQGGGF
jgi:Domain of unknown function (DUF5666)